jgi:FkbM family methyltransferase
MMNIKKIISDLTGYWFHKRLTLPVGVDLFEDIQYRLKYGTISTVFDVGANVGQTANWIRHYVPDARLYCFEPVSSVYEELVKNTGSMKNIQTACIAFGDKNEEVTIRLHREHSVLNSLKAELMNWDEDTVEEKVTVLRMDDYCRDKHIQHIDLLKIDTEGFELNVLKGAADLLLREKVGFILCEVGFLRSNERNTYFADMCELLSQFGYYFQGMYQISGHSWDPANVFGNALFMHKKHFKDVNINIQ